MKRLVLGMAAVMVCLGFGVPAWAEPEVHLWFPAEWQTKTEATEKIAAHLSRKSGMKITPRVVRNYQELMAAFEDKSPELAYVGSMVSAVLWSRRLAQPLFQAMDGEQFYAGVMLYPKGQEPLAILKEYPEEIAYAMGTSAGELSAKVASEGKAGQAKASQGEAAKAVGEGKAKAAFVKDYWWEKHKAEFPGVESYRLPGISENRNPDHVLLTSFSVSPEVKAHFFDAAIHAPELFDALYIAPFDASSLDFTLSLMSKAKVDPLTYVWAGETNLGRTVGGGGKLPAAAGKEGVVLDGAQLVVTHCQNCHLLKTLSFYTRDEEQWGRTVIDMVKNHGVKLSEAEIKALNSYMANNFGANRKQ